jgi:EamA-like transporter family
MAEPSPWAAVLANAQPMLILLPAWWLYGERLSWRTAVALVIGFAGLLLVALPAAAVMGRHCRSWRRLPSRRGRCCLVDSPASTSWRPPDGTYSSAV